jgi:hypothetical protein
MDATGGGWASTAVQENRRCTASGRSCGPVLVQTLGPGNRAGTAAASPGKSRGERMLRRCCATATGERANLLTRSPLESLNRF